jgi:hypothetical protein
MPDGPAYWHKNCTKVEQETPCTSTLLAVERNTPCTSIHRKKKVREFPVPSRDVTTKLSLGGNNDVTELFLPGWRRETREPFFTVYYWVVERDTPRTSILLEVERETPSLY